MQFRNLLDQEEDRAVSPVIGVILMVAITVILAAVIGTFVLGLGDQVQQTAPNAQFSFDFDENGADSTLEVTHTGGDGIDSNELFLRGNVETSESWSAAGISDDVVRAGTGVLVDSGGSGEFNWDDSNGDSTPDYAVGNTVRVVWEDADSDRSSTLRSWSQN